MYAQGNKKMQRANLRNPRFVNRTLPARLAVPGPVQWRIVQARLRIWSDRHHTRRHLRELLLQDPERLISDLGLSIGAAVAESRKWFWQP